MLRVLQVVASVNCNIGGPALTVSRLATSLAHQGVDSTLASLDYVQYGPQVATDYVRMINVPAVTYTRWTRGWSPAFWHQLLRMMRAGVDVVHNHGLWMFPNYYARRAAVKFAVPLVISPRGMLEEWSLAYNRLKKLVAWQLYEKTNLRSATLFHATSIAEAQSIRSMGLRQPIAVITNGIDVPDISTRPDRRLLERRFPELAGKNWLLFLSRLHPKKGITELLQVWKKLESQFKNWHLIVAGPDLDGYGALTRRKAVESGIGNRITFTGMLAGNEKFSALANADLFVLPTHSENFGIAVAEALAHHVPVITTTAAPWSELPIYRCGWWIDPGETALVAALANAMALPTRERRAMGERGRKLMEQNYSWTRVASEMKLVYQWLCEAGSPPGCVVTE